VEAPSESDAPPSNADAAEEQTGIYLFPPPGTKPIKIGIVVPDDFEVPPGYVKHYQTTDGGKQLQPILMFHPDYQPVDDAGNPIALPADRVVPPDMAPPGLPIEMLEVPDNPSEAIEEPASNEAPDPGEVP
jgi:hypothetical protein